MKAIVIGRNYTSLLGMIRAAGMAGCEVIAIRTVKGWNKATNKKKLVGGKPIEASSKYVKQHFFVDQGRDELIKFLLENCRFDDEKAVLLPVDDFVASTIDLNQDKLRDFFVFPNINNTQGEVVRLMDKNIQKEFAKKAGLNVADGWVINIKDGKYDIPDGIKYPVFTKPEVSFLGNKRCMKRCNNESELINVIQNIMKERECPLLIERFISIEKEYGILGFSCKGHSVIPGIVNKLAIGHGTHNGVTLIGSYSSLAPYGELKSKLLALMSEISFTGLFDIDLYESDGIIYFNELNLRLGAFGYAAIRAGINMPEMLINALYTNDYRADDADYFGTIKCISEKVNLDDYSSGYISWKQYNKNIHDVDYGFLYDDNDIQPYKVFESTINQIRFRRTIKNILRR